LNCFDRADYNLPILVFAYLIEEQKLVILKNFKLSDRTKVHSYVSYAILLFRGCFLHFILGVNVELCWI